MNFGAGGRILPPTPHSSIHEEFLDHFPCGRAYPLILSFPCRLSIAKKIPNLCFLSLASSLSCGSSLRGLPAWRAPCSINPWCASFPFASVLFGFLPCHCILATRDTLTKTRHLSMGLSRHLCLFQKALKIISIEINDIAKTEAGSPITLGDLPTPM